MKIRHKKLIASGIALSLAGVLGAGALLQTSVSVQASYAMMPGIEQIVKDTSEEKPFKILEIVDNTSEAEIGYYVSGQEPYVKLYEYKYTDSDEQEQTMKFQSLEEGLSKLPTSELRKEFANGTQTTTINQEGKDKTLIILFPTANTRKNIFLHLMKRLQDPGKMTGKKLTLRIVPGSPKATRYR